MLRVKQWFFIFILAGIGLSSIQPAWATDFVLYEETSNEKKSRADKIQADFYKKLKQNSCLSSSEEYNYSRTEWRIEILNKAADHARKYQKNHKNKTLPDVDLGKITACSSTCSSMITALESCESKNTKITKVYTNLNNCLSCCPQVLDAKSCKLPNRED